MSHDGSSVTFAKCGSVRRLNPYGMRCPSTFCCPTHARICEMLMKEPFDPASAMAFTAFLSFRLTWAEVPDSSRAVLSTFLRCSSGNGDDDNDDRKRKNRQKEAKL